MRIVIVGDLQFKRGESINDIARDISELSPDYTILLGDYGYWECFGSYEVFSEVSKAFKMAGVKKLIPLIGNHDVQNEAGERLVKSGFVWENFKKAFGYYPENKVLEFDDFRVFCINIEPQKKDSFYFEYECFVSDSSFENICRELEKEQGKPTIMITHAPPVGCGLITVPTVHVRASNAYLNQDHEPEKWADLAQKNRQIIMWFSGHYHMGHKYPDSRVVTDGLAYFTTGAPTSATRDGTHHTRIIDEQNGRLIVKTFDHDTKMIEEDYIWDLSDKRAPYSPEPITGVFSAGCGRVVPGGLKMGANGRVYAMTDNGFLWEIDINFRAAMGTIHYSDKYVLDGFQTDSQYIWRFCSDLAFGHRYSDVNRFMRGEDWKHCVFTVKNRNEVEVNPEDNFTYNGRVACRIDDEFICSTFNDENGKLIFEIINRGVL